jgi:hypothetical protein
MTTHVRTKWHHLRKLVLDDEVYITAPQGGRANHWSFLHPNVPAFGYLLTEFGKLPRFVVDSDVLELVMRDKYQQSLLDMKRAGVMRLPFPAMMIEFQYGTGHHIVMLRDLGDDTSQAWEMGIDKEKLGSLGHEHPFYGIVMRVEKDEHGEYVVLGPSHIGIDVEQREGEPYIGLGGFGLAIFECAHKLLNETVEKTWTKDGGSIFRALAAAMLVMHTEGVKREVVECDKINRARIKSHKPIIPRHVVLSIGKVYRSRDADARPEDYDKRRSPIPHWRRGHLRNVRYGEGREKVRPKYIPPRLVAFKEFETIDPPAKTYQVQK